MKRFITGLPRSRTRWFADYFDAIDGVDAEHEPLNGMKAKQEFYDLVESGTLVSDSGLFITDFQERWPDHKTVIIERPVEDVYQSLVAFFDEQGFPRPSMAFLMQQKAAVDALEGLRVPFHKINDRLEDIHDHLGIPFDPGHADLMTVQNLQIPQLRVDVESYKLWGAF